MANKYDIEDFLSEIETFIKARINPKLLEIDAIKADSITLGPIDDDAYTQQSLDNHVVNHNPFLWYGISEFVAESVQDQVSEALMVFVFVVLADPKDGTIVPLFWRYQRALKEIFEEGWDKASSFAVDLKVSQVLPNAVDVRELVDTSVAYKTMGIILEAHIP